MTGRPLPLDLEGGVMSTGDDFFPAQTCPDCGGDWPHTASEPCAALTLPLEHVAESGTGTSPMNPAPSVVPIRTVKPDSLCLICGIAPASVVRGGHELAQQANYLCPSWHIWQTRWVVEA